MLPVRPNRTIWVKILFIGLFLSGIVNSWRAIGLWQQQILIVGLGSKVLLFVTAGGSLIWAILFLVMALFIWQCRENAGIKIITGLIFYAGWRMILLLLTNSIFAQQKWGLPALLHSAGIIFAFWAVKKNKLKTSD